ncbi:MAG: UDP-glucose--hexose-1-phosphate uridylyltransferase [Melioribacteraceae bacterium]
MEINKYSHRRKNILTGEWILISPHRTKRPWQGETIETSENQRLQYDPECYLCPGNKRANGEINPDYKDTFVFTNDFSAIESDIPKTEINQKYLLVAKSETGLCRVVNFSPRHDLTLAEMDIPSIIKVISSWQEECRELGKNKNINHIQIFENKGAAMGNSNPHPHCQIWAQESIPTETAKELVNFKGYFKRNGKTILEDYLDLELKLKERIVYKNKSFTVLVPFWAFWPFETVVISNRKITQITELLEKEKKDFAAAIQSITSKYDNLFNISFPYSSGIHQAPFDGKEHPEFHLHMHFYPPLLRSASIKKFRVGYEMMAEPQRDITPEDSAKVLRKLSKMHYKLGNN